jgi:hypothetical protein
MRRSVLFPISGALCAFFLLGSPAAAFAQDKPAAEAEVEAEAEPEAEPEATAKAEDDSGSWDKTKGAKSKEGAADGDDDEDDESEAPAAAPDVTQGGGWGVGGDDEPGRFLPSGKTGKLKDIEDDEIEDKKDEDATKIPPPRPGLAYVDTAIGFGTMVVPNTHAGDTEVAPAASFIIGAQYRFADIWRLSIRIPISSSYTNGPSSPHRTGARDRDEYRQIAFGGVELGVRPEFSLKRYLKLPVGLALTLPTAQGDIFAPHTARGDVALANVNYAAMASRGWLDRAMFAPERFGITPSVGARLVNRSVGPGKVNVSADTKVDIMIRVLGEDVLESNNTNNAKINSVAVNWSLKVGADYHLFKGLLQPGLDLWIASGTALVTEDSFNDGGTKAFIEPKVGSQYAISADGSWGAKGSLGYMIPIGGSLGGKRQDVGALHVNAGMFF